MTETRQRWPSNTIFILASIGSSIGLGNIWRFPYLVGKYGGGAFLIPFMLMITLVGIPLMMAEFAIGQKMQRGVVGAFKKIGFRFGGIGWGAAVCSLVVSFYYAVIMAWSLIYVVHSYTLAWKEDPKTFFFNQILEVSSGASEMGHLVVPIVIALFFTWVAVYCCLRTGVQSVSKAVIVAVPVPILCLLILMVRGLTLSGGLEGLGFFLRPDYSALLDAEVWAAAAGQTFFSLSLGFGIMVAYASYMDEKTDMVHCALVTSFANVIISVLAGVTVFSTLGHMAEVSGVPIAELAESAGPSLAFVVFPKALSLMPGAQIFSIIFFLMLVGIAIDSLFSLTEAFSAAIYDYYPHLSRKWVLFAVCFISFLGGTLFATSGGIYYLDIADHFISNYGLVGISLAQTLILGWVFGAEKLRKELNQSASHRLSPRWVILIQVVAPVFLLWILLWSVAKDMEIPYEGYPQWTLIAFGWSSVLLLIAVSVVGSWLARPENGPKSLRG